jgi:hypothetical protein
VRPRTPAPPLMRAATLNYSELRAMLHPTLHFAIVCLAIQASRRELFEAAHIEAELRRFSSPRRPYLHRDWAHPAHICAGTGLAPPTSAPGLGSPRPHLHRDCTSRTNRRRAHGAQHRDVASVKLCIVVPLNSRASLRRRTPQRCIVAPLQQRMVAPLQ